MTQARPKLFQKAASSNDWANKSQRIGQESPEALLKSELKDTKKFLNFEDHQGSDGRKRGLALRMRLYLTTMVQALKGRELGVKSKKVMKKWSKALDHPLSGNLRGSETCSKGQGGSWQAQENKLLDSQMQEKASLRAQVRATWQRPTSPWDQPRRHIPPSQGLTSGTRREEGAAEHKHRPKTQLPSHLQSSTQASTSAAVSAARSPSLQLTQRSKDSSRPTRCTLYTDKAAKTKARQMHCGGIGCLRFNPGQAKNINILAGRAMHSCQNGKAAVSFA